MFHTSCSWFVHNNLVQFAGIEVFITVTLVEAKIHYDCSVSILYVEETSSNLKTACLHRHSLGSDCDVAFHLVSC